MAAVVASSPSCCWPSPWSWLLTTLILGAVCGGVSPTYVSHAKPYDVPSKTTVVQDKGGVSSNEADSDGGRRYSSFFKHDKDVKRYLTLFRTDAMIWRCKNALQPYWNWKPLPVVELYCEAIGTMTDAKWYHNGKLIHMDDTDRYKLAIYPHHHHGHYFYTWIDFRLRIFNATRRDSGIYTFEVIGKGGSVSTHNVYVDISNRHRKRKWRKHYKKHHMKSSSSSTTLTNDKH